MPVDRWSHFGRNYIEHGNGNFGRYVVSRKNSDYQLKESATALAAMSLSVIIR